MPTLESNGDQKPTLPAGVYRHPESGQELIAVETQLGNPQASAYTRMGFEYVGPVKKEAIASDTEGKPGKIELPTEPQTPEFNVPETPQKTPGELEAELQAAKAREADLARRNTSESLAESKKKEASKEGGSK